MKRTSVGDPLSVEVPAANDGRTVNKGQARAAPLVTGDGVKAAGARPRTHRAVRGADASTTPARHPANAEVQDAPAVRTTNVGLGAVIRTIGLVTEVPARQVEARVRVATMMRALRAGATGASKAAGVVTARGSAATGRNDAPTAVNATTIDAPATPRLATVRAAATNAATMASVVMIVVVRGAVSMGAVMIVVVRGAVLMGVVMIVVAVVAKGAASTVGAMIDVTATVTGAATPTGTRTREALMAVAAARALTGLRGVAVTRAVTVVDSRANGVQAATPSGQGEPMTQAAPTVATEKVAARDIVPVKTPPATLDKAEVSGSEATVGRDVINVTPEVPRVGMTGGVPPATRGEALLAVPVINGATTTGSRMCRVRGWRASPTNLTPLKTWTSGTCREASVLNCGALALRSRRLSARTSSRLANSSTAILNWPMHMRKPLADALRASR